MSMLKTLATVAAGAMVARGVGKAMNRQGGGMGGQGGLGGMLGGMLSGAQRGGGGLGGMLGGQQGGAGGGLGGALGGMLGGQQGAGGMGGGLGGLLSGARGGGGGLGGLLETLGGAGAGAAMGGAMGGGQAQAQQLPPQPSNGSLGDALNSAFDNFQVEPSDEQENQARILLKAMIAAAKSDGQIDAQEREKLLGQLGDASPEEVEFVKQELAAPLDLDALVSIVPGGMQQQVYLMSVMAIDLDSPEEAKYLDALARGLSIAPEACNAIHDKLGAPRLYT